MCAIFLFKRVCNFEDSDFDRSNAHHVEAS